MTCDNVLQWLTFLGVVALGLYFRSYLMKKAENLATKEDVSEITKQVESMKATIGAQLYIHQVRYQNEFNILMDLSEKLVALRDSAHSLRPILDYVDSRETEDERKQKRLKKHYDAAVVFYKAYETKMPFYPEEIYQSIKKLDLLVRKETIEYDMGQDKGFDKKYWDAASANALEIAKLADEIIALIRTRVKYWEDFKVKS
ncbi:MAG: hypothetical protein COZ98_05335 [Candidatus Omnitrophica bacterium CG_4_8_14_3_um_filter_43_15]|nr:MAG: hypothetical protein COS29_01745 [Candidatus Omnitrophica bacterium CG02_land_8_20_14_3_00__42_8]PIW79867.1 MAG: hypothetical protein COZ98_05335 [Candidatus Omnitrophica bacterium CG_4_8_14_3_um_filter_43_15]